MVKTTLAVIVLIGVVAAPGMCLESSGNPWDTTSWSQQFVDSWGGSIVQRNYWIESWGSGIVPTIQTIGALNPQTPTGYAGPMNSWISSDRREYILWTDERPVTGVTHSAPSFTWTFNGTKQTQNFLIRFAALDASGNVLKDRGWDGGGNPLSGRFGWNGSNWSYVGDYIGSSEPLGTPTPELGTWILLGCTGLVGLVPLSRRRRK